MYGGGCVAGPAVAVKGLNSEVGPAVVRKARTMARQACGIRVYFVLVVVLVLEIEMHKFVKYSANGVEDEDEDEYDFDVKNP